MSYEERIAAAQAKMNAFKEKMAAVAEKTKAAHEMRKEEIAEAIDSINADLDELDEAIIEDYQENKAAIGQKLDKLSDTVASGLEEFDTSVDQEMTDFEDELEGNVVAANESARLAKERRESKINAIKINAQMRADVLKEKIAQRDDAKDKAAMESYIIDLLDYAECCQQVAYAAAMEADMALLEATQIAAEYKERFGEEEVTE